MLCVEVRWVTRLVLRLEHSDKLVHPTEIRLPRTNPFLSKFVGDRRAHHLKWLLIVGSGVTRLLRMPTDKGSGEICGKRAPRREGAWGTRRARI